jgi:hypothetical protein
MVKDNRKSEENNQEIENKKYKLVYTLNMLYYIEIIYDNK